MDNTRVSILAKSTAPSGESSANPNTAYNTATMEALQEASNIMSGKKKVKWNSFQPGITKTEAKNERKKIFNS
jgi:hypothetical protein